MGYTTLSIRNNNRVRKYILFYADYLQEAWLSEVKDGDKTEIVRQYKCKNTSDLAELAASLSKMGEIMNLSSDETVEQHLAVLQMTLEKPLTGHLSDAYTRLYDKCIHLIQLCFKRPFAT